MKFAKERLEGRVEGLFSSMYDVECMPDYMLTKPVDELILDEGGMIRPGYTVTALLSKGQD